MAKKDSGIYSRLKQIADDSTYGFSDDEDDEYYEDNISSRRRTRSRTNSSPSRRRSESRPIRRREETRVSRNRNSRDDRNRSSRGKRDARNDRSRDKRGNPDDKYDRPYAYGEVDYHEYIDVYPENEEPYTVTHWVPPTFGEILRDLGYRMLEVAISSAAQEVAYFFMYRRFGPKRGDNRRRKR